MKTQPFYLVIAKHKGNGRLLARRVTARRPWLEPGETMVRLTVEVPDGIVVPVIHNIVLDDPDYENKVSGVAEPIIS